MTRLYTLELTDDELAFLVAIFKNVTFSMDMTAAEIGVGIKKKIAAITQNIALGKSLINQNGLRKENKQ